VEEGLQPDASKAKGWRKEKSGKNKLKEKTDSSDPLRKGELQKRACAVRKDPEEKRKNKELPNGSFSDL